MLFDMMYINVCIDLVIFATEIKKLLRIDENAYKLFIFDMKKKNIIMRL